VKVNENLLTFL